MEKENDKELLKILFTTKFNNSLEKETKKLIREETHYNNDNNINSKFKKLYNYIIADNLNKNMGGERSQETRTMQNEKENQNTIEGLKEKHKKEIERLCAEIKKHNEEIKRKEQLIKRHEDELKKLEKEEEEKKDTEETNMENGKNE